MWTKKVQKGVFTLTAKVNGLDLKVTFVEQFEMFKGAFVSEYWQAEVVSKDVGPNPKHDIGRLTGTHRESVRLGGFRSVSRGFKSLAEAQCWCVEATR